MDLLKVISITSIIYLILIVNGLASMNKGVLWRPVKISHSRLLGGARQRGSHDLPSTTSSWLISTACSLSCLHAGWCNLWCSDPSSSSSVTSCLFFDMFVVAEYQETDLTDALDCYFGGPKDYLVGATIEGKSPNPVYWKRRKENLLDGIYDFKVIDTCYMVGDSYNPWFKIDLGSVKPIGRIMMVLQHNSPALMQFDYEVRVGSQNVSSEDFGTQKLFGYFKGPGTKNGEIVFTHDEPVMARYISVQRWSDTPICNPDGTTRKGQCRLLICHMEISN